MVAEVKSEHVFGALVKGTASNRLIVVDFFSQTCGPCKMIAPYLEELEARHKEVATIVKVDVFKLQNLAEVFDISSMPTLVFLKNGKEVDRVIGADVSRIERALQKNL